MGVGGGEGGALGGGDEEKAAGVEEGAVGVGEEWVLRKWCREDVDDAGAFVYSSCYEGCFVGCKCGSDYCGVVFSGLEELLRRNGGV